MLLHTRQQGCLLLCYLFPLLLHSEEIGLWSESLAFRGQLDTVQDSAADADAEAPGLLEQAEYKKPYRNGWHYFSLYFHHRIVSGHFLLIILILMIHIMDYMCQNL